MYPEQRLMNKLRGRANSVEGAMTVPIVSGAGNGDFRLGQGAYQPPFKAQIQLNLQILFFTEVTGTYTPVAPGAIAAQLRTKLPFFLFGITDFNSGYPILQQNFPVTGGWTYGDPVVYGKDVPRDAFGNWDINVTALLEKGDVIQPFTAITAGPINTLALVIVRCTDVPFGSLLSATESNLFKINMIRITLADETATELAQLRNAIIIANETMFGKYSKDTVNPNSFKNPEQNQANIVDVLAKIEINKEKAIAQYINYNVSAFEWNVFIADVVRV